MGHSAHPPVTGAGPDEPFLLARARQGDLAAFEEVVRRYQRRVYGVALRIVRAHDVADDVAQETFLRVWRAAASWQPGRVRFTTWLYRIGRNYAIDRHRRRRDETGHDLSDVPSSLTPEGELEQVARHPRVRAAVQALPERQRAALMLCHFQGLSNQEAALVLLLRLVRFRLGGRLLESQWSFWEGIFSSY